jgi:hypothetical protein
MAGFARLKVLLALSIIRDQLAVTHLVTNLYMSIEVSLVDGLWTLSWLFTSLPYNRAGLTYSSTQNDMNSKPTSKMEVVSCTI